MPLCSRPPLRFALGALACLAMAHHAAALAPPPDSRITQVKVYPGSATVERVARVVAGTRTLTFSCLPAGLDAQSVQVTANATVRLGETSVLTLPRASAPRCATHPLDGQIRELETRKDTLQSENDALDLVTGYLKGLSGSSPEEPKPRATVGAKQVADVADTLRRTGQDALLKQRQLARKQADLDRELAPLVAERARAFGPNDQVVAVTVTLATAAEAEVRLSYQVNGPGWTPTYRALLDTTTRKVRIERQALVAQATGEDWRGVKLLLSTGQPRRETAGRLPTPWHIGVQPPVVVAKRAEMSRTEARLAAPMAVAAPAGGLAQEPLFDVAVFNQGFATEFDVPQAIDVPSSGQRVAITLGQHEDTARLAVRTSPRIDPSAFLVADLPVPAGVWPAGPMQLYRDGAFVGLGRWNSTDGARLTLSFGRDELVRVVAEPERDNLGTGGFAGNRVERKVQRAYTVENRHTTPIAVQVLEAAPVSIDEQVRVAAQFAPQPAELAWNQQPGVAMWTLDVAPGRTARVAADYVITYPKDVRLMER